MTDDAERIVRIFYSSTTDPELMVFYSDGISYLKDSDVELDIIDIAEEPEKAREFDITTTPTVLVEKDGEIHKEFGVVSYFSGDLGIDKVKELLDEMDEKSKSD